MSEELGDNSVDGPSSVTSFNVVNVGASTSQQEPPSLEVPSTPLIGKDPYLQRNPPKKTTAPKSSMSGF